MKWRKITVDGREWYCHIGTDVIEARYRSPKGDEIKLWSPLELVTRRSAETLERGRWKKTTDGMVTPKLIAAWIHEQTT
jgi:hypothetical protein